MSGGNASPAVAPQRLDIPADGGLASRLFPPLPTDVEWGLDRTRALLAELDAPHLAYPTLHVGGTNGKGSVAAVWASVLAAGGRRVGLYTSPHLCSFVERYQVGGRPVASDRLLAAAGRVREGVRRHGLTFFEAATVLAFELFRREEVDVGVVEVGLGGRLDATNVVQPEVTAVTGVALDHAEYLGETVGAIAAEKAGIAKRGSPFVTAETDPELVGIFRRAARDVGAPFHRLDPAVGIGGFETGAGGSRFVLETERWGGLSLETPFVGRHQVVDAALAVRALELLDEPVRPEREAVVEGVRRVRWPGRLQVERIGGITWILDVAHNSAAVRALADTLADVGPPRPRVALVAILGDKDWRTMLPPLFRRVDRAILTVPPSVPSGRLWDPEEAASALVDPPPLEIDRDFCAALDRARRAAGPGGSVVATGSHYTVGAALRALGRPPYPES